jgi:hypothetical protein
MTFTRLKTLALVSVCTIAAVAAVTAEAASSKNKAKQSTAAPIPTGKDASFVLDEKYFIMEDDCTDSGPGGQAVQGQGCDGELLSGKNEFDLWIDGDPKANAKDNPGSGTGNTDKNMTSCEDKLTASKVTVIMNASDGKTVDTTPMLVNGVCSPLPKSTGTTTPPPPPPVCTPTT